MDRITSAKNPLIQRMRGLKTAHGRKQQGAVLVEGEVMIREALQCGLKLREGIVDENSADFALELCNKGYKMSVVGRSLLESVCDTRTPQGVCAAFNVPSPLELAELPERVVALDGLQDPGNIGTIWRTADAAGFQALLLGAGCADALSPKVLRAAMGSGFRIPFAQCEQLALALGTLRSKGYCIIASDLHGSDFYSRGDIGEKFVLVIGNEARGISEHVREQTDVRLKLPMRGGAESLNAAVAAGIMMYELMRDS